MLSRFVKDNVYFLSSSSLHFRAKVAAHFDYFGVILHIVNDHGVVSSYCTISVHEEIYTLRKIQSIVIK